MCTCLPEELIFFIFFSVLSMHHIFYYSSFLRCQMRQIRFVGCYTGRRSCRWTPRTKTRTCWGGKTRIRLTTTWTSYAASQRTQSSSPRVDRNAAVFMSRPATTTGGVRDTDGMACRGGSHDARWWWICAGHGANSWPAAGAGGRLAASGRRWMHQHDFSRTDKEIQSHSQFKCHFLFSFYWYYKEKK